MENNEMNTPEVEVANENNGANIVKTIFYGIRILVEAAAYAGGLMYCIDKGKAKLEKMKAIREEMKEEGEAKTEDASEPVVEVIDINGKKKK